MQWRLSKLKDQWAVRIGGSRYRTGVRYAPETRQEAEAIAAGIARAHVRETIGQTCEEICSAYLADMPNRANAKSPDRQYYALKRILPYVASLRPEAITRELCRSIIASERSRGAADGTIIASISALRTALRWHNQNTPATFELPAAPPPRGRFLTREEVSRLLDAASAPHIELFIRIAIGTAGRKEAILGLQWGTHVDFERGTIWLGFKAGGKGRAPHMKMPESLKAALWDAYNVRTSDWVVEYGGGPVKSVRKGLRACYDHAGLTDIPNPAHVLRHTAGVWMAEAGVPLKEIADRMGHNSITTTERHYAKHSPEGFRRSTDALEI